LSPQHTRGTLHRVIDEQTAVVKSIQDSPSSIDVETMKLKRLIDKRNQEFDAVRKLVDDYNRKAKAIIDSIGR
jgi:hypothetical protein